MLGAVCIALSAYGQTYIYVKHDALGGNNGTSWAHAYTSLQLALSAALSGDNIWVAAGTYEPSSETGGTGVRYRCFQLKNGVGLYGGFAGTEDPATFNLSNRDFDANETILSGATDEVYHVFRHVNLGLNSTAILNGFTVSGGKADGSDPDNKGGGMLNSGSSSGNGSSPTIVNCIFENNQAGEGGAIYNSRYSSPAISYSTFENNSASTRGGAVFNTRNTPTFSHCTFTGNETTGYASNDGGGAIYNTASNAAEGVVISNCTFTNNSVPTTGTNTYGGGAIYSSLDPGKLEISSSTFNENTGKYGGAIYHRSGNDANRNNSDVSISQSNFFDNLAEYGGAIFSDRHHTIVTSSYIRGNEATEQAGGFYSRYASSKLINSLISGNKSGKHGGGMYFNTETPEIINTTISGNYSGERGGGISIIGGSVIAFSNSVLYGNTSPEGNEFWICATCSANTDSSLYKNASGDVFITTGGSHNVTNSSTSDPLFLNALAPTGANTPNTSGNYMIKSTSPAVDAAGNAYVPGSITDDLRGKDRIIDGDGNSTATVDMGAYEYDPDYCNSSAPAAGDGSSTTPYQISTLGNLCWISQNSLEWSKYFIQTANIDASDTEFWNDGAGFSPIGNTTTRFTGSYDGKEYSISNLYINRDTTNYTGLFGRTEGATITDLGLVNATVTGYQYVGALLGNNSGCTISNCYSTGSVIGSSRVGGLVGRNRNSSISSSYATGNVTGSGSLAGGLVGTNEGGNIDSCFTTANVGSKDKVGGLAGLNDIGVIENSYARGSVTRLSGTATTLGGFLGENYQGKVNKSFSTGAVIYAGAANPTDKGFCGSVDTGGDYEMTGNFWDTETSGQTTTSGSATGETTANMKTQSTFTSAGWNFSGTWAMSSSTNDGYPYLGDNVGPLPVTWVLFSGMRNRGNNVVLNWITATETNCLGFCIERSTDAQNFQKIGFIDGSGSSNQANRYTFTDHDSPTTLLYYRLKQTDYDGSWEYSSVIAIANGSHIEGDINVYPNPFDKQLMLEIPSGTSEVCITISDLSGRIIYTQISTDESLNINTDSWSLGIYILRFHTPNMLIHRKIIKDR